MNKNRIKADRYYVKADEEQVRDIFNYKMTLKELGEVKVVVEDNKAEFNIIELKSGYSIDFINIKRDLTLDEDASDEECINATVTFNGKTKTFNILEDTERVFLNKVTVKYDKLTKADLVRIENHFKAQNLDADIKVNGKTITVNLVLKEGDTLDIIKTNHTFFKATATNIEYKIENDMTVKFNGTMVVDVNYVEPVVIIEDVVETETETETETKTETLYLLENVKENEDVKVKNFESIDTQTLINFEKELTDGKTKKIVNLEISLRKGEIADYAIYVGNELISEVLESICIALSNIEDTATTKEDIVEMVKEFEEDFYTTFANILNLVKIKKVHGCKNE